MARRRRTRSIQRRPPGRPTRRERLGEIVRQATADILNFELTDPRISRATVTRVQLSGDLALARVYVSVLGSDREKKETLAALRRARGRVRTLLGSRVHLRATPEVRFVFDPAVEFSIRLETLLERERSRSKKRGNTEPRPEKKGEETD